MKSVRLPLLIAILFLAANFAVPAETGTFRTWTDIQQKRIEAELTRAEGDQVELKLRDGRAVTVSLASLSAADRQWIGEHSMPTAPGSDSPAQPQATVDWPRMVTLPSTPTVEVIREDPEKKEYIYETKHYRFECDSPLGANLVREFSGVFESTWLANCLLPPDFRPTPERGHPKFRARIFTDQSDYTDMGGPAGTGGVYMSRAAALMLPLSSLGVKMFGSRVTVDYKSRDYSTLIHETTHQMMNRWLDVLPVWYVEGSAEYIALAKYDSNRLTFLQQDKRLKERLAREAGAGRFQMVPLSKLMTFTNREWLGAVAQEDATRNYTSALVLTYYFYNLDGDGKGTHLVEYVRAMEKLISEGTGSKKWKPVHMTMGKSAPDDDAAAFAEEYLLRGRSYDTLQKDVQESLRRGGILVDFAE